MDSLVIGDRVYFFDVIRKPIRSLNLRLKSQNTFTVTCPHLTPGFVIKKFILSHQLWIAKHASTVSPRQNLWQLSTILILGTSFEIIFKPGRSRLDELRRQITVSRPSDLKILLPLYAKKLITSELFRLQNQFPFSYRRLTVRNQKTRFGSCSSRGNLNFNWQIIFFPHPQFRHILLHEVAHLKIKDHSKNFWNLVAQYDPDFLAHRRWLKKDGPRHFLFR